MNSHAKLILNKEKTNDLFAFCNKMLAKHNLSLNEKDKKFYISNANKICNENHNDTIENVEALVRESFGKYIRQLIQTSKIAKTPVTPQYTEPINVLENKKDISVSIQKRAEQMQKQWEVTPNSNDVNPEKSPYGKHDLIPVKITKPNSNNIKELNALRDDDMDDVPEDNSYNNSHFTPANFTIEPQKITNNLSKDFNKSDNSDIISEKIISSVSHFLEDVVSITQEKDKLNKIQLSLNKRESQIELLEQELESRKQMFERDMEKQRALFNQEIENNKKLFNQESALKLEALSEREDEIIQKLTLLKKMETIILQMEKSFYESQQNAVVQEDLKNKAEDMMDEVSTDLSVADVVVFETIKEEDEIEKQEVASVVKKTRKAKKSKE